MSSVLCCRVSDDVYNRFTDAVNKLDSTPNIVLGRLVFILVESFQDTCKDLSVISSEALYDRVSREVDDFLRNLSKEEGL